MPPSWKLIIVIAAIIVVASGALVVYGLHLLARAIRKGRREEVAYDDEMADYVADQQTAVGRVAVPQPRWHVWDDEAEAGMTERQVQMLREGYVLLPEDLRGELMCPMLLPVDGCNCGPCIAARIEQARQESPSAEVYELTEREWADYVAANPNHADPHAADVHPRDEPQRATGDRQPGISQYPPYVPRQRDGGQS